MYGAGTRQGLAGTCRGAPQGPENTSALLSCLWKAPLMDQMMRDPGLQPADGLSTYVMGPCTHWWHPPAEQPLARSLLSMKWVSVFATGWRDSDSTNLKGWSEHRKDSSWWHTWSSFSALSDGQPLMRHVVMESYLLLKKMYLMRYGRPTWWGQTSGFCISPGVD